MSVQSMTGFARTEGAIDGYSWTWEVKSVNGRNLDLRFRLPPGHDSLEAAGRKSAPSRLSRGNVSAHLALRRPDLTPVYRTNRAVLDQMLALAEELRARTGAPPATPESILALPGVIESVAADDEDADGRARRDKALLASLDEALDGLVQSRGDEGRHLAGLIEQHVAEIERLCGAAEKTAGAQPDAIAARLRQQIDALTAGDTPVTEERLAQEVALLASRADVREEIDRLGAHIAAARKLMADGGAIGRRLDFLCQEFNREANTLCSKSADKELTAIGLDLKATVDRLREQVQNVE